MKLNKKLILSCAALAACATTLVTSTFAWYTTNDTVTASSVVGETAVNEDSLLLISDTGNAGDWGSSTDYADQASAKVNESLVPVAFNTGDTIQSTFVSMAGDAAVSEGYIAFDLYFATGAQAPETVYVKQFDVALTGDAATALPKKSVLTTAGLGSSWDATTQGTYGIDIRHALVVTTVTSTVTAGTEGEATTKHYGLDELANGTGDDYVSTMNAHEYYNDVLGAGSLASTEDNISHTAAIAGADGELWELGSAPVVSTDATAKEALKVTFYIWLNGWDTACFDAVQGQGIQVTMAFTTNNNERTAGIKTTN